ncbi:MAG: hypothetical protein WB609_14530 [Candidatus Cybelea sp.]
MRIVGATLLLAVLFARPVAASDPLASLRFLVGTWSCGYQTGKTHLTYKASFAYDMNDNWMRESDSWSGGGDLGMFTYEPKKGWTVVILEPDRTTTIFRASGSDSNHVVYHSFYPHTGATEVFDRVSPTRFTVHFTQTEGGKTTSSTDTCVKT